MVVHKRKFKMPSKHTGRWRRGGRPQKPSGRIDISCSYPLTQPRGMRQDGDLVNSGHMYWENLGCLRTPDSMPSTCTIRVCSGQSPIGCRGTVADCRAPIKASLCSWHLLVEELCLSNLSSASLCMEDSPDSHRPGWASLLYAPVLPYSAVIAL